MCAQFIYNTINYLQNIPYQSMHCKYCTQRATGINYRPNSSLENIPTCNNHATSLFIPFSSTSKLQDKQFATKLQELLQKLMDSIVAEFNLIKSEVLYFEQRMKAITQDNAMAFRMNCQITSPYIIIPADEELLLTTMIKRIKFRYEREKVEKQRNSLYGSRMIQNQSELLNSQTKSITSKKYLFFTPQSTQRSRVEVNNPRKAIIIPATKLASNGQKGKISEQNL